MENTLLFQFVSILSISRYFYCSFTALRCGLLGLSFNDRLCPLDHFFDQSSPFRLYLVRPSTSLVWKIKNGICKRNPFAFFLYLSVRPSAAAGTSAGTSCRQWRLQKWNQSKGPHEALPTTSRMLKMQKASTSMKGHGRTKLWLDAIKSNLHCGLEAFHPVLCRLLCFHRSTKSWRCRTLLATLGRKSQEHWLHEYAQLTSKISVIGTAWKRLNFFRGNPMQFIPCLSILSSTRGCTQWDLVQATTVSDWGIHVTVDVESMLWRLSLLVCLVTQMLASAAASLEMRCCKFRTWTWTT